MVAGHRELLGNEMSVIASFKQAKQQAAEREVERFQDALGPFVVAAETTRMPMLFANAEVPGFPIIFVNDSFVALIGYAREELLGRDFDFFFAGWGSAEEEGHMETATRGDGGAHVEVDCRRRDGSLFPAAVYVSPVRDHGGRIVHYFSSFVDLTAHHQHKLALGRLLSLQADMIHLGRVSAMGTMATTLAHELNQPLTAITNYAAACRMLMAAGKADLADIAKDLTGIEQGAIRAGAIISRLRNMTLGKPSKRESFDLHDAIRESLELVRVGSCEGVAIESDFEGVRMIEGDRVQIQQVMVNLVKNGCEAAAGHQDARVSLTTHVEHGKAIVCVDNNGGGVSAERTIDLFAWASSDKPDGMGVGLSISRTIVEAHDGEIWLASDGDSGTRFCFSLPIAA
jgi:two-component system sensor kinase FixL